VGQPILAAAAFQAAADEPPDLDTGNARPAFAVSARKVIAAQLEEPPERRLQPKLAAPQGCPALYFHEKFFSLDAQPSRMAHYERRLPHWDLVGRPVFVTFRLHGSLPARRVFPPERLSSGKAFAAIDQILGRGSDGPLYLNQPAIAELVVAALHHGDSELRRYQLHSYVVMPNHVHLLVTPHVAATRWLGPLKGITAYQANRILGQTGRAFWQDESYDHVIRDEGEFERVRAYVESDPVRAGLAAAAEDFRWSSAGTRQQAA
jgi:REP element-mobilizing transposase RayT